MSKKIQYISMTSGAFVALISGVNTGWSSPYLPYLLDEKISHIPTSANEGTWCAVMSLIGCPFGAVTAAYTGDMIGRKYFLLALTPILFANFIWISFAKTILELMIARFFIAICDGSIYTILPMYLGEIADSKVRGFIGSSISLFSILGTIFINIIGPRMSIRDSGLICSAIPLIHFLSFVWMPESPYYYCKIGNVKSAMESLVRLRGYENVKEELDEINVAVSRQEIGQKDGFLDLIRVRSNRKAMIIYIIVSFTNKFSGKNPIIFFTSQIFQEADGSLDPVTSVVIFYSSGLIVMGLAMMAIDKFGRRVLLLNSTLGSCVCLALLAGYFTIQNYAENYLEFIGWLPITALISYNIIYGLGLAFCPVLLLSELFPTSIKAKALCTADTISVIYGVTASKYFQLSNDVYGMYFPFWTFVFCTIFGAILIYFYVPETKGKTLEEIQQELIGECKNNKLII